MTGMTRPYLSDFPAFYQGYAKNVDSDNILETLRENHTRSKTLFTGMSEDQAAQTYQPGKWSIKEVLGHLIDTERVFVFRAMSFARNEQQPLPGFDENTYVPAGKFGNRTLASLLDEYNAVRLATIMFFESLTQDSWDKSGIANGSSFSVKSLAYIIAGHEIHHLNILKERYLAIS